MLEARDRDGRFYPFAERVRRWRGDAPDALVRYLRDDLLAHVHQRLSDDAALVAIQRTPPAPDAAPPDAEAAAATEHSVPAEKGNIGEKENTAEKNVVASSRRHSPGRRSTHHRDGRAPDCALMSRG